MDIISRVVEITGGEGGGHSLAAGAKIPLDSEDLFIAECEKIMSEGTVSQ